MQNSQEISWWLEILKIIGTGIVTALITGLWLNVRTEKIKSELQARLYEFQTKFSTFHNDKVKIVGDLYELLTSVKINFLRLEQLFEEENEKDFRLQLLSKAREISGKNEFISDEKIRTWVKFVGDYELFYDLFQKKRIYLDRHICNNLEEVFIFFQEPLNYYYLVITTEIEFENTHLQEIAQKTMKSVKEFDSEKIKTTLFLLESSFRELITVENSNHQIEKKQ